MSKTALKTNPEIELPSKSGVAVVEKQQPVSIEQGGLDSLMARMATDPNCDVEKFERIVRLNIEVENGRRDQRLNQEYNEAMSRAQSEMAAVIKDKDNSQTKSKYASYAALDRAARPIYTKEGFALSFDEGETTKPDHIRVICFVYRGGCTRVHHVDQPADGKGAKGGDVMTKTHATGSAFTYGQRNLLKLIFNLATIDKDDDGNAASVDTRTISAEQAKTIRDLIASSGADLKRFCEYAKVEEIEEIPARHFKAACAMLNKKKAAAKKGEKK